MRKSMGLTPRKLQRQATDTLKRLLLTEEFLKHRFELYDVFAEVADPFV